MILKQWLDNGWLRLHETTPEEIEDQPLGLDLFPKIGVYIRIEDVCGGGARGHQCSGEEQSGL